MAGLRVMSTDSAELLCEYSTRDAHGKAFWVPEDGTLRFWGDSEANTVTGVDSRSKVRELMRNRYTN